MDPEIPKTLGEAMAAEPLWLRTWIQVLVAAIDAIDVARYGMGDGALWGR